LIGMRRFGASVGVTAAFNLNLLARINRELDGDFMLSRFQHAAMYNSEGRRIEMHLISTRQQTVNIHKAELSVTFQKDETIWTESSYKYDPEEVVQMAKRSGFDCEAQWIDEEWPFAQTFLVPTQMREWRLQSYAGSDADGERQSGAGPTNNFPFRGSIERKT